MRLYVEKRMTGTPDNDTKVMELTPEVLDDFLRDVEVFPKIGYDPQVIADLVCEFTSEKEQTQVLMKRYDVTERQALLAERLPFQDTPLYFNATEYHRQVARLRTLQKLLQDMYAVLNK